MARLLFAAGAAVAIVLSSPATAARADETAAGAALFGKRCVVCHRPGGEGQVGLFPPIKDSLGNFLATESGRGYLADVMVFGLAGAVEVGGAKYVGQMRVLPPLTDQEAASVLNYVLTTFNAASLPAGARQISVEEIAARRAVAKSASAVVKSREGVIAELKGLGLSR